MKRVRCGWPTSTKCCRRHLQRRLDGFGAPADQVGVADACRGMRHQVVGQRLGHLGGEETGVCIGQAVDLRMHGGQHVGVAMAQAGHGGATAGVDVGAALGVKDLHALGPHGHRQGGGQLAVQHVGGGGVGGVHVRMSLRRAGRGPEATVRARWQAG
jgi:hypothetical protein